MEVIREITLLSSIYVVHESTVMMHLDTNIFLFFFFFILIMKRHMTVVT